MRDRLQLWFNTLIEKWKSLEKIQKIRIAAIGAGILVALFLALFLAFRTTWQPAFNNVDAATAAQIEAVLGEAGIRTTTNLAAGEVLVPTGQVDAAQMAVTVSPVMWDPGFTFLMAVDLSGMGVTAGMQHEMILRAREGEANRMLSGVDFITAADVRLHIPNVPVFMQPQTPSTATVRVTPTRRLTPEEGEAIALMVARMVEGLSIENVVVSDNQLNVLFRDGAADPTGGGGMSDAMRFEFHARDTMRSSVTEVLLPAFDEISVGIFASFNWRNIEELIRVWTSPLGEETSDGLTDWFQVGHRIGIADAMAPIGEPGLPPQGFDPPGYMLTGPDAEGNVMMQEYDLRRSVLHNLQEIIINSGNVPGEFVAEDSSVAVTATNHTVWYEAEVRELGLLDDVTWLEFQDSFGARSAGGVVREFVEHENQEAFLEAMRAATGVETVVLTTLTVHHFVDEMVAPLPLTEIILFSLVLLFVGLMAFALIRRTAPEVVEEIEPELSVEDLLVSSQLEEARESEIDRLAEITYADSTIKEQIDKFAAEKPENVAQLLRNWINEDWG